jgi:DNA replication and repair protein RecF
MYVEYLSLTNFRNYARLETALPDAPVVIHGANAQGKTSLLEAIYYLATSHSPYTTSDRQLINWCTEDDPLPFARLAAEIADQRGIVNRLEVTIMLERAPDGSQRFRKNVRQNGVEKRVMDVIGLLNVVLFLPRDLTLVEGSPSDRRHFMDTTLSQVESNYAAALDKYEKTLPQRNALLKRIADKQASPKELPYWDEQLIQSGSVLVSARQRFLRELEVQAQRDHYELTGKKETLTLRYQPILCQRRKGINSFRLMFSVSIYTATSTRNKSRRSSLNACKMTWTSPSGAA